LERLAEIPESDRLSLRDPLVWWVLASVALMIVGAVGPWARALGFISVSGLDGDGWFVFGAAIAGAVVLVLHLTWGWLPGWGLVFTAVAGVVAAAAAIVHIPDLVGTQSAEFFGNNDLVSPGWGIWVSAVASVSLVAASAVAFVRGGRPT